MIKIKKKRLVDPDMPVGKLTIIKDFLPPPDQLVFPEETVKVTLSLTKSSLEFFKRQAFRQNIKYQRMIREVVDRYAKKFQ
ncbi:MAG: CopG family transcriptional regulator [Omnitrophica WOR_2 bacterium RIFCSPHIGHO2_02_FULL_48_11]|nr:MAG: CopG family transcriptional regulator [Omnitrophica WOR_2 bacterium RIFCSPHIGHO2_02_FULL_48_11]